MQIREITVDDADVSLRASRDAFGGPLPDRSAFKFGNGFRRWGIFDGPTLAAKAVEREYTSVIGGREINTSGAAGVLVSPEYRGAGLAREVMTHLLAQARDRGAVISTLFRTAPALYRSLGYEQVAELCVGELPTSALRGLRARPPITVRRAKVTDGPAIRAIYARVVQEGSCLLTRTGPSFDADDQEMIDSFDGITLAVDADGSASGYVSWNRGEKWGPEGVLAVSELHAKDAASTEALLAVIGSFDAVTPTLTFRTSGTNPIHWLIPGAGWSITDVKQYMLRVVDLAGAVEQRGWPRGLTGTVDFAVVDPDCPWNSGSHRLVLDGGTARLEPGSTNGLVIAPRGLAVLLAGGATTAALRRGGLLVGGSSADHEVLDAAMAGPRPAILDFF
jgi:predicted acetyltransferase